MSRLLRMIVGLIVVVFSTVSLSHAQAAPEPAPATKRMCFQHVLSR